MTKLLEIHIEKCMDCPYCRYPSEQSDLAHMRCSHPKTRYKAIMTPANTRLATLEVVPEWCPLPNLELFESRKHK